jgi:hypothetical protein
MPDHIVHLPENLEAFGTSGFYKKIQEANEHGVLEDCLVYGPNGVANKNYRLHRTTKDQVQYPVDGWYWFDSEEEARTFLEIPTPNEE